VTTTPAELVEIYHQAWKDEQRDQDKPDVKCVSRNEPRKSITGLFFHGNGWT